MNAQEFASVVGVVAVDFQGEAVGYGNTPDSLATYLRTEAFPLKAPPSLRSATGYGGMKLFGYQGQLLCISLFQDIGRKDRFQRAVASACVLIFPLALFNAGFRNLLALRDLLADVMQEGADASTLEALQSIYTEAAIATTTQDFIGLIQRRGVDYDLLAAAAGLIVAHRKLKICTSRPNSGLACFDMLYALLPFECFDGTAWSSYASSLDESAPHEEIVVYDCRLIRAPRQEKSWLQDMRSRLRKHEEPPVDPGVELESRYISAPNPDDPRFRITQRLVKELCDDRLRLGMKFEVRYRLFRDMFANIARHRPADLTTRAVLTPELIDTAKLDVRASARLQAFIEAE